MVEILSISAAVVLKLYRALLFITLTYNAYVSPVTGTLEKKRNTDNKYNDTHYLIFIRDHRDWNLTNTANNASLFIS